MAGFAPAIFLGAFLLFQVQPLLARFILPWFGGAPAVWAVCLLFFQTLLLAGYLYAHGLRRLSPRIQAAAHLALLLLSFAFLPIAPDPAWKPTGAEPPVGRILGLLAVTVGLPYVLLAATGPLLQAWFHRAAPGRDPYRLYALSNLGSLLALATYPFVFEPHLRLGTQATLWSWGYVAFAAICGVCGLRGGLQAEGSDGADESGGSDGSDGSDRSERTRPELFSVLALAACGSSLLLATTNQLCQDVMVVPFLWILPLALYLLSFILCFDDARRYSRRVFGPLLVIGVVAAGLMSYYGIDAPFLLQIAVYALALFAACMFCHGEITARKPSPRHLTGYYLAIAAGGALGGVLVALIAPLLFLGTWEYPLSLVACLLLGLHVARRDPASRFFRREAWWRRRGAIAGFFILLVVGERTVRRDLDGDIETARNFYGVLRVKNSVDRNGEPCRVLKHGRIMHGLQYSEPERRMWKTSYYAPTGGCGIAFRRHPKRLAAAPLRVGVIGLGVGAVAAHAEPGDLFRFYEIDPDVVRLCEAHFTYLREARGTMEIVLGDARLRIEQEREKGDPLRYDLLLLDAFSSDAIPSHLLTLECFRLYKERLAEGGILALHISNRFLDLKPPVFGAAEALGMQAGWFFLEDYGERGAFPGSWVLMGGEDSFWNDPDVAAAITPWTPATPPRPWTDDFLSLWSVLKR